MSEPTMTPLPYADPLTRFGVIVDRGDPDSVIIYVSGARWRDQRWLFVVLSSGLAMLAGIAPALRVALAALLNETIDAFRARDAAAKTA